MNTILKLEHGTFPCATPEEEGIRSSDIIALLDDINREGIELHSIHIFRHGKLIAGGVAAPFTKDSLHRMQSAGKTVIGIAVLIAIQEGYLSLDSLVVPYFKDRMPEQYDRRFDTLTVYHLLTMCSGHDRDTFAAMVETEDWVKCFFAMPPAHAPGTYWLYNNGVPHILSCLIQKVTGQHVCDYLQERLIQPMELKIRFGFNCYGEMDPAVTCLSPESMAKFALLHLQEGNWNGVQLVDQTLMRRAGSNLVPNGNNNRPDADSHAGYGFQLWRNAAGGFRIVGGGGQYGLIYPDGDLAVVMMAFAPVFHNIPQYVANRIYFQLHDQPLPRDDRNYRQLCNRLSSFSLAPAPASAASSLGPQRSGRTYQFPKNSLDLQSLTFMFHSDHAEITIQQGETSQRVFCGYRGSWVKNPGSFIVPNDYSEFSVIYGEPQEYTLISGGWTDDDTFVIHMRSAASMGMSSASCDFRNGSLVLTVIPAEMRGRNPRTKQVAKFKPITVDALC